MVGRIGELEVVRERSWKEVVWDRGGCWRFRVGWVWIRKKKEKKSFSFSFLFLFFFIYL